MVLRHHAQLRTCAMPGVCCSGRVSSDTFGRTYWRSKYMKHAVQEYLDVVYPTGVFRDDDEALSFFATRHWFYNISTSRRRELSSIWDEIPLVRPPRFRCTDGFFGSGLLHLDVASRFPEILPCSPGLDCVRRQASNMAECSAQVSSLGSDVWVEVWHLAFNGRLTRRQPSTWAEFGDDSSSPWWYIYAPGSGVFYHAGTTLASSGKASMIACLLERWVHASDKIKANTPRSTLRLLPSSPAEVLELASKLRAVANGTECSRFGWGRWRCHADRVPNDIAWDELMLGLGRALQIDSLFFTGLMWGRAVIPGGQAPSASSSSAHAKATVNIDATTELVDLRIPQSLHSANVNREELVRRWAASLMREGRLSLRDPMNPANSSRVL